MRCMHEAGLYAFNSFVTLTYEESPGTLVPSHFVDFMKRLRWHNDGGIRFFQCGEYGEQLERPHHHALLFGYWPSDAKRYVSTLNDGRWVSRFLEDTWGHGRVLVGSVTFESAAYVARYALKKVVGPSAEAHYGGRVPEYLTMSRRPGIGRGYIDKYRKDVYAWDRVVVRGAECKPPRYYDSIQEKLAPSVLSKVKARRRRDALADPDGTGSRLIVREAVKEASIKSLRRTLEEFG